MKKMCWNYTSRKRGILDNLSDLAIGVEIADILQTEKPFSNKSSKTGESMPKCVFKSEEAKEL